MPTCRTRRSRSRTSRRSTSGGGSSEPPGSPSWANWAGELLVPADQAVHVYDAGHEAGADVGLRHAGYHALNSLRLEKAYRSWGHDIGSADTPLEAGLGFAVAWDKPERVHRPRRASASGRPGVDRRLVQFVLSRPGGSRLPRRARLPRRREGGKVASASYGWTLGVRGAGDTSVRTTSSTVNGSRAAATRSRWRTSGTA